MANHIYFIDDNGKLQRMPEQGFENEDLFQKLLEDHPELLNGDNHDDDAAWLLVKREMEVPDAEKSEGRWAVDHLFLDRDGIPTLVEVKRSTDTRIRREVVGQMLDYAANAVLYWPVERIRSHFDAQCEQQGTDPAETMAEFLAATADTGDMVDAVDEFWESVKTNIEAERIRLLFVADEIPSELHRIVEFLNGQMDPAEVLAVELKQYAAEGRSTLVPRTIGQTSRAERRKPGTSKRKKRRKEPWTEPELLSEICKKTNQKTANLAKDIIAWSRSLGPESWGNGATIGTCRLFDYPKSDRNLTTITVLSDGNFEICCQHFPWGNIHEGLLREYVERLGGIAGLDASKLAKHDKLSWGKYDLSILHDPNALQEFKAIHEWFVPVLWEKLDQY